MDARAGQERGTDLSGRHVLLIDDEPDFLDIVSVVLGGLRLQVTAVSSGKAALAAMRTRHYDLVIADLRMPGLSGDDTLAAIRALDAAVPILITTGCSLTEAKASCQARGARGLLRKPFNVAELLGEVTRALDPPPPA
jgi:CheY-like chemotaxis protein